MRKFLALPFALALVVPLAACGGGDDEESSSSPASASASAEDEETTTTTEEEDDGGGGDSDYCDVVDEVIESGDAFGDDFDFEDDEAIDFAEAALGELRDNVEDDDVREDYETILDSFDDIVSAFTEAGDDPEAQAEIFEDEELVAIFTEFSEAGERIDEFTLEECGTTLDGETATDDGGSTGEDTSLEDFADDVEACEGGDMAVCDELFSETPVDSEAEQVAEECGGEDPEGGHFGDCEEVFG